MNGITSRPLHRFTLVTATALALAVGMLGVATTAQAEWPDKPIRLVVPYPAGGLTDIVSRTLSEEVGRHLGTNLIVENRAGAGGLVGMQAVLQAPRDGNALVLVVPATMVTLPLINADFKVKPLEDFAPITMAVNTYLTLVTDPKLNLKSVADFVVYAKRNPGKMNVGVPGMGTSFHFNNALMATRLGFEPVIVPYQGEVQILNDVAGGQLQYALVSNAAKSFIDGGKTTALAVAADKRVLPLPNVPTFKELGIDFSSDGWVGYAAASGTPPAILNRVHGAFIAALNNSAVSQRIVQMGYTVQGNTPEQFRAEVQKSTVAYRELLRSGAVKIEK